MKRREKLNMHVVFESVMMLFTKQEAQLSLTNRTTLFCTVVEVLQHFLSEYVDKKFTTDYNVALCSGTHGTGESLNRGVAVSFTVKLEVCAGLYS